MKKLFSLFLFILLVGGLTPAYCKETNIIKVLAWWGYLDANWIKNDIWDKCNTHLAIQSYKDPFELNKNFAFKDYDIVIYESSQRTIVKSAIPKNIKINNAKDSKYHNKIHKIFNETLNNNTSLFFISNIVFLFNPKNLYIDENDTLPIIIKKLKSNPKHLVVVDDPVIINTLIQDETKKEMNAQVFNDVFDYENFVISNHFIDYKDLGIFMTWSGVAIYHKNLAKKEGIDLEIITIPKYSYVTADFISQITQSNKAQCVFNLLTSQNFLHKLQNETYYYSPFMQYSNVTDVTHKKLYKEFDDKLKNDQLKWLLPTKRQLEKAILAWEDVILDYGL